MRIDIICSDVKHPFNERLEQWIEQKRSRHDVRLCRRVDEVGEGDLLFLISCHEIVRSSVRTRFKSTLVIHASDLPLGRGWSPHIWQIIEGQSGFSVTLLEAADGVDSGRIWSQRRVELEGHELADEINARLFSAELELMDEAVESPGSVSPREQDSRTPSYYRKRTPADSELDPNKTIAEQFDLMRIADRRRFPNYFLLRGHKYILRLEKADQ
jgi:methionyl-tRNA formyltransferase